MCESLSLPSKVVVTSKVRLVVSLLNIRKNVQFNKTEIKNIDRNEKLILHNAERTC